MYFKDVHYTCTILWDAIMGIIQVLKVVSWSTGLVDRFDVVTGIIYSFERESLSTRDGKEQTEWKDRFHKHHL